MLTGQEFPYYKGSKIAVWVRRYGHGTARSSFVPYEAARFGDQGNAPGMQGLGSRDLVFARALSRGQSSRIIQGSRIGSFESLFSKHQLSGRVSVCISALRQLLQVARSRLNDRIRAKAEVRLIVLNDRSWTRSSLKLALHFAPDFCVDKPTAARMAENGRSAFLKL